MLVQARRAVPRRRVAAPREQRVAQQAFTINDGDPSDNSMVWIATGERTGPQSRTYGIISALLAGKQPPVGTQLDIEKHLIGRRALVTVAKDEKGYMKVVGVSALPSKPGGAKVAAPS
jgi:hypothetical protein